MEEGIINQIGIFGIVPVVRLDRPEDAVPLARALIAGGLPCAEITFRTEAAEESIRRITAELPEMLVGAGTVLTVEQAKRATAAGAGFIVTPGFNPPVVEYCVKNGIPVTPGVSNPSDIDMALGFGLKVLKFFPAEVLGGIEAVKAISAAYGMVKFIPTGGVNTANLNEYLSFPKVHAVGGSWMVKPELIGAGNFAEITRITREAVLTMLGFTLAHVGINTADAEEATAVARRLCAIFNFALKEGASSNFAGTAFEVMKGRGPGAKGHIAIQTNHIHRAVAYLERNGFTVDMGTARESNGVLTAVYLKEEVAGFALHLLQKR